MKPRFMIVVTLLAAALASISHAKETKNIEYRFASADPVVFSHDLHLKKYNNNCRICHNALFDLRNRRHFTMAEMEKTKSCGACHTGIKAFSVSDDRHCTKCHKGKPRAVTYRVKGATEAVFSHQAHITATGGKCKSCHNGKILTGKDRGVTMAQMEKGRTCGACHNGKTAFTVAGNCGNCHNGMKPKEIVFKAKGITKATFSHDLHLGMYACKDCHTGIFPYKAGAKHFSMADMAKGKSCGSCHNGNDAFTSNGDCDKCHKNFKPRDITYKTDMGEAKFSHDVHLSMFKCVDCHTKRFPYRSGVKHFTMGDMENGQSCGGCHDGKDAFTVKDNCNKCHKI
ncbi:cytochrome c3 family protein [Geobacter sp. DSM 9736]|uniref:cytochrome c3 family protein n=1 Tax=Geobacter sp. DSM 9736 TaxID=1277350 RepID=UPI000B50E4FE|nr:cytochrome c3 family protein [Geobacter sp. DSM 9736]SNB45738.1 c(7)-type cytochrome triheme domain-containing protein [Geobacter sp. DSM 9736]